MLRLRRVKTYYAAVRFGGASAFFEERNTKNEIETVEIPVVKIKHYLQPKRKIDI
jgi:hypothetical protein